MEESEGKCIFDSQHGNPDQRDPGILREWLVDSGCRHEGGARNRGLVSVHFVALLMYKPY